MQKKWSWSTTGYGLVSKSHDEIIELCKTAGFSAIEGAVPLFDGLGDSELQILGDRYHNAGIEIETFHLPFTAQDDLASFYETSRRKAVDTAAIWIERSARVGAKIGIQHPTTNRFDAELEGMDLYIRQLGKSIEELLPVADRLGYTIALENLPPSENGYRFSSLPEHFEAMIRAFHHPNLGFILDTGHALISRGREHADEFHEIMAPHLVAYHLADNAGDRDSHLAPGHGLVDWRSVFRRAAELEYSGCMCIETPPFASGPNQSYSDASWKQMVDDTEALAVRALEA